MIKFRSLALMATLVLAGCGPAPASVAPPEPPIQVPTALPTSVPTAARTCPEPTAGTQLLTHEGLGYCMLYPDGLVRIDIPPHEVCLIPEGPAMACHTAVALFDVTDAAGGGADQIADELIADSEAAIPGVAIRRTSSTVSGQPAVVLEGLPGVTSTRQLLMVHADRLYRLTFILPDADAAAVERFERLYDTVVNSFTLVPSAGAPLAPTPGAGSEADAGSGGSAMVVFVKDGTIQVWEEATGQTRTMLDSGDVIDLTMSDDGQVVAFLRRSVVGDPNTEWHEQSALWAVDISGANPRQLVSAEELRDLLGALETESTNIPQMEWIRGTHRLLYNGWTYIVQAEGESHAVPGGLFLVDADALTHTVLIPAVEHLRFALSPDGQRIALMSPTGLSFVDVDGTHRNQELLTNPNVGLGGGSFPAGVWTQDSRAFVVTGPVAWEPTASSALTIWRVPVDGPPAEALATYSDSHSDSVTFSPDGQLAAYFQSGPLGPSGMAADFGWFVIPLAAEQGALATPNTVTAFWQNLHWSPAGIAYAIQDGTLVQLCPSAAQDSEVCDMVLDLGEQIDRIHWIDGARFLWVTREPAGLYFGDLDGHSIRLGEGAEKFAAVAMTCRNDAELVTAPGNPGQLQIAPGALFRVTWLLRNTGTCSWDTGYRLAFLGGGRLSGPRSMPLRETVPPGADIELPVMLIAPGTAGTYRGQWQLLAPDGSAFGTAPTVDIAVPSV